MTRLTAASLLLFATGTGLCGFWVHGIALIASSSTQQVVAREVSRRAASKSPSAPVARIEILEAGVATSVFEGVDEHALARGAGHFTGTALPGGLGNFAAAGHRDSVFRNLQYVKPGMYVLATGETGTYRYRVTSVRVISPEEIDVLNIFDKPSLTLITCYPFHFLGPAPKRYAVSAELTSLNSPSVL